MKKLTFNPKTLEKKIVKDSLEATNQLENKEPVYLVGGMGVQSYLPTLCRRPTADIDYSLARPLSYPDFREMVKPVGEFLQDKGYSIELKKGSSASMLIIYNKDKSDGLVVEFSRRNDKNFQSKKNILEREFKNSRKKIIEGRTKSYTIASPEDLVVPKIVRSINSLERSPELEKFLSRKLKSLPKREILRSLRNIAGLRYEAMMSLGDVSLAEKLRFNSDLYDIRVLSEITGFNEEYFKKVENEWLSINSKPELKKKIFESTMPGKSFE